MIRRTVRTGEIVSRPKPSRKLRSADSQPKESGKRTENFFRLSNECLDDNLGSQNTSYAANNNKQPLDWSDPLPTTSWSVPIGKYHPGGFAFVRKQSVHTGIDLCCPAGTEVMSVEPGRVVGIEYFTGPEAASPWYNTTMAVLVEGPRYVVLYGELQPHPDIAIGKRVEAGTIIGNVLRVLKNDKGNGTSMLHFELYKKGTTKSVWWEHGQGQPRRLLDPTQYLLEIKIEKK